MNHFRGGRTTTASLRKKKCMLFLWNKTEVLCLAKPKGKLAVVIRLTIGLQGEEMSKSWAPAKCHRCSSSLMVERSPLRLGCRPSNTPVQRDQATKITTEFRPILAWSATLLLAWSHQSSKEWSSGCGAKPCKPSRCITLNHIWREKTQDTSRWLIVSSSWSHIHIKDNVQGVINLS